MKKKRPSDEETKCKNQWTKVVQILIAKSNELQNSYKKALQSKDAKHWKKAMDEELEAMKRNKTWTIVPKKGSFLSSSRYDHSSGFIIVCKLVSLNTSSNGCQNGLPKWKLYQTVSFQNSCWLKYGW